MSQWSAGTSQTEESIHSAYCSLIEKAEYFIYIEVLNKLRFLLAYIRIKENNFLLFQYIVIDMYCDY